MDQLYLAIDVWQRQPHGKLVRYRCLQLLPDKGYCVASAGFHDVQQTQLADTPYLEQLAAVAPELRVTVYPTLEAAIAASQTTLGI